MIMMPRNTENIDVERGAVEIRGNQSTTIFEAPVVRGFLC